MKKRLILSVILFLFIVPESFSSPDKAFIKGLVDRGDWSRLGGVLRQEVNENQDINSAKLMMQLSNAGHVQLHLESLAIVENEGIRGDPYSNQLVGNHYYLSKNNVKAMKYYKKGASLGDVRVIAPIISIYVARKDIVSSYTWATIGVTRGLKDSDKSLRDLGKYINKEQKRIAIKDAREWLNKYFP